MRSNYTIGTKLMAGAAAMLVLMMVLSYSGLSAIGTFREQFNTAVDVTVRKLVLADTIDTAQTAMVSAQRGIIVGSFAKDSAEMEKQKQTFRDNTELIQKSLEEIRSLIRKPEAKELAADLAAKVAEWQPYFQEVVRHSEAGETAEANRIRKEVTAPIYNKMGADARRLTAIQAETMAEAKTMLAGQSTRSRAIAFSLLGLALLVGAVVVWVIRGISNTLRQMASEMGDGAEQVAAAAGQVSSSSQSLAQGSSEQAASIEETSASSEEIHSMAQKNSDNSRVASENMTEASQRIVEANRDLEQMVTSMNEINASSDKISKIIKVIDEIAFQTNILALNAAVEAARAGEAGMGFAVVADEVRNLAQRCAQAAKDTAGLIEESIAKSNDGKSKLGLVATAVRSITESADKAKTLVEEVKLGSEEQSRGIEQVAKAVSQMEKVSQSTAASAEQSASASEELSAQSDTLRGIVNRLKTMVGGGQATQHESRSHVRHTAPKVRVASHSKVAVKPQPVRSSAPVKTEFPMDEDFKEF